MGTAELCDFQMKSVGPDCSQQNSHRKRMVMQLLLKGMHDVDICKRVLCRTENNELLDLMDTVDYIAAEEASSASFNTLLQPHTIVAGKSTYARQKQAPAPSTTALRPPCKCPVCGGTQDCTLGDCSTL